MQDFHRQKQTSQYRAQQSRIIRTAPRKSKKVTFKISLSWITKIWDALESRETQSRVFAGIMALAMIMVVAIETRAPIDHSKRYSIANYEGLLLDDPVPILGKQVTFDVKNQEYVYNEGYQQPKEVTGQIAGAKLAQNLAQAEKKTLRLRTQLITLG